MTTIYRIKQTPENAPLGLYIHIPFCASKCAYCDFYSMPGGDDETKERYVRALIAHMARYAKAAKPYRIDTVYIGGGTPTVLPDKLLLLLIRSVKRTFRLAPGAEFTVEANPATVSLRTLRRLRRAGVNRLSLGLQSANNDELAVLGRRHTFEQFKKTFADARKAKITNISVDVMFGLPDQTWDKLKKTLTEVILLAPEHVSLYNLKIEANTPLGKNAAKYRFPSDDDQADMYLSAVSMLESAGYFQYEISNFARHGAASRHNRKYWNCEEYLGFGPGAHSYFGGHRYAFERHFAHYVQAIENPRAAINIVASDEEIDERERMGEYIMLRLRLTAGIRDSVFKNRFGRTFTSLYGDRFERYVKAGYATHDGDRYALTPRGMFVSNAILTELLDFSADGSFVFDGISEKGIL